MDSRYRSFWLGTFAAVIVAVIAGGVLNSLDSSASSEFKTSNVRLGNH